MTSPHAPSPLDLAPPAGGLTYARARLLLGITGVGTQVVLAGAALAADLPGRLLPSDPSAPVLATAGAATLALLVPVALLLPLDVLGGLLVVRARPPLADWLRGWARGVAVQVAVWFVAACALVAAARAGGALAVIAAALALQAVLLAGRGALARAVAPFAVGAPAPALADAARAAGLDPARVRAVATADDGFVGGWMGTPFGRAVDAPTATLWVPAAWASLPRPALVAALARRRVTRTRGLHARGVLLAVAWNTVGLALALGAPGADVRAAAGLLTVVAWGTLWSFLGLLLLPTPSRRAVFAVDRAAAADAATTADAVRAALVALDARQDDEATRATGIETIFHPVPARAARLSALEAARRATAEPNGLAAHHAARHALYLAWALGSPLSRAVHCNVGRPALWVVWPGD